MVNRNFWSGILVLVLVFEVMVVGCDNDTTDSDKGGITTVSDGGEKTKPVLNGTWYSYGNVYKYQFNNGNYEYHYNGNPYGKGTYTTTNDSMTMTMTHIGRGYLSSSYTWLGSSTWVSRDEYKNAYLDYYQDYYRSQLQQTYGSYVASYGTSLADYYFLIQYGNTDINTIVDSMMASNKTSIDNSANQLYTKSTVAYSLSIDKLILGGTTLTR